MSGPGGSGVSGPGVGESHGALESRGAQLFSQLDRTAETAGVDAPGAGGPSVHPLAVPVDETVGHREAHGASIAGTQVHSVALAAGYPGNSRDDTLARMTDELARAFAQGVAAKDMGAVGDLLHPAIDFRGMTPGRVWDADGPEDVLAVLGTWFDDGDVIENIELIDTDSFADRDRVGYRLRVRNADGLHLVEQQAYLSEREGRIGWLRILCAGYRPVTDDLNPDPDRTVRVRVPPSGTTNA